MNAARSIGRGPLALATLILIAAAPHASAATRRKAPARKPATHRAPAAKPRPAPDATLTALKGATRLEIIPSSATLDGPRAMQHLVVGAVQKDGVTYDVTDRVTFTLAHPATARVAKGVVLPQADGETRIVAHWNRLASPPVAITVRNAKSPVKPEFVNDVMPILSKAGCNASACHGSPVGKGGFKLSLFGYEPELDHPAIVTDSDGRRIDANNPAQSLLLLKPTMAAPHGGGLRFKPNSAEYNTLLVWLKAGAPGVSPTEARVTKVDVMPEEPWLPAPGTKQHLIVTAHLSDGSTQDVTEKVLFSSNDDAIADVDGSGVISAKRPGETAIMVRYLGQVGVSRVAVLPPWKLAHYPKLAQNNVIDEKIQTKLEKLRVVPSDLCTDEEFIRRATLDTCGILPTVDEVRAFTSDTAADKRAKLIDKLLDRPEFVDLWTLKWNDTLRNNQRLTRQGLIPYSNWIHEQFAKNRPYDEFVRDLITASGKNADIELDPDRLPPQLQRNPRAAQLVKEINAAAFNPAANYYIVTRNPLDVTSATSQIFLGVRIECARCHNHPFEKWTQNDYYSLAGFFNGITARGTNQTPRVVAVNPRAGGVKSPKTKQVMEPRTLDGAVVTQARGDDKRAVVAAWMTAPENPFFAKAAVNRLWAHYMGRGIVEPIDDMRVTNPPSNPELLDALAKEFVEHKFDLKDIHRLILNSRTYQQSSRPNQYNRQDTNNFARYYPKRMMAEQLYDSISQATGVFLPQARGPRGRARPAANQYGMDLSDLGPITRVTQLPALPRGNGRRGGADLKAFLDTFGKPRREVVCECERSTDGNIGQALAMINGDAVNDKIAAPRGRVQQLIQSNKPDAEVIEELYLATLTRKPTPMEQNDADALIRTAKSRAEGIEDVMWGLLNSREFLFVH
jgi:Protein of unknown function (DUF1553)/Protein of unknown function (DUF1549)